MIASNNSPVERPTLKYDVRSPIDLAKLNPHAAHSIILRQIPPRIHVLDVGCATGYLGRFLVKEQGCTVDGIEQDLQSAEIAKQYYGKVWIGSAEDASVLASIPGPYDLVLCAAVLEHMTQPDLILQRLRRLIAPGGSLIASVPNVAHWSLRWSLLRGRWDYTDYGLLDRTHLRFYTLKTARKMLEDAGYRVSMTKWSDIGVHPFEFLIKWLPRGQFRLRMWLVNHLPTLWGYELVFVAQVRDELMDNV